MESAPHGCDDDVVSHPTEASSLDMVSSYYAWEMDDTVMMDLFWPGLSDEMDLF